MPEALEFEIGCRRIAGYPGYWISADGTPWSKRSSGPAGSEKAEATPLNVYRRPYGMRYCVVCMRAEPCGSVSCHYVHELVLTAFVGQRPAKEFRCCHYDNNTANNWVTNLRWDTHASNMADKKRHGTQAFGEKMHNARLSNDQAREIIRRVKAGERPKDVGKDFDLSSVYVSAMVRGSKWRFLQDEFK